jgi:hypothetical protein
MLFSYPGYYVGSFESALVHFVKENIIIFCVTSTLQICLSAKEAVPRAPEKEDLDARELLRRSDSAGPVSPTCFDV